MATQEEKKIVLDVSAVYKPIAIPLSACLCVMYVSTLIAHDLHAAI